MQQIKNSIYFFVVISILILIGCNESSTSTQKSDIDSTQKINTDTTSVFTNSDTSSMPAYDPAMAPLTVGAKFSKKLADTLNVKMHEISLKPGDTATLHSHPDDAVYVLQGGKISRFLVEFSGAVLKHLGADHIIVIG